MEGLGICSYGEEGFEVYYSNGTESNGKTTEHEMGTMVL